MALTVVRDLREQRTLTTEVENTVASIARLLGVSRSTIYKYEYPRPPCDGPPVRLH